MKSIFLDTSAYSGFKRGIPAVTQAIRDADHIYVNAIVIGELLAGFDLGKFREANRKELKEFLRSPTVSVHPLTEETAERYSFIYQDLRRRGKPIPTNDLWISACVMELGTGLLTADSHFQNVHQIQTHWLS